MGDRPPLDFESRYIWNMYWEIKKGAEDVDYQTIAAYQSLTQPLTPFEIEALVEIDLQRRISDANSRTRD